MDLLEMFKEAGITGNESRVYLELLKKGELKANTLAKSLSMDRTLSYTVLNHLIEKGFVSYKILSGKKVFHAESPNFILDNLKKKELVLKNLVSQLNKIQTSVPSHSEVRLYEGVEGLRAVSKIMMKAKSVDAFGATGRLYDLLYEAAPLAKELSKKGYKMRVILPSTVKVHEFVKLKGVSFKVLNTKSEATTTIFGDYVVIHLLKDKPLAILIKNKDIAESYKNYFTELWNRL